jgi:hypothetical protein
MSITLLEKIFLKSLKLSKSESHYAAMKILKELDAYRITLNYEKE